MLINGSCGDVNTSGGLLPRLDVTLRLHYRKLGSRQKYQEHQLANMPAFST